MFDVDVQAAEVRKHGIRIRLQEQPFKLLLYLVERPGVIVSRQELATQLWPEGTFVDAEHGLNAALTRLRQALHDSAGNPRYIETIARKGYRFIAPVTDLPPDEASMGVKPQETPLAVSSGQRSRPHLRSRLALAVLTAVVLFSAAIALVRRHSAVSYYSAVPLTSFAGSQRCPSFAPDGDRVAFSWDGERQDNFDIYVKQIGVDAPLRLTTNPDPDLSPVWSPDGRTIAFVRVVSESRADVLLVSALAGGEERRILQIAPPDLAYQDLKMLAWSPDGKSLVIPDTDSADVSGLSLVSIETGAKRRLTVPPTGYDDLDPAFSPDGRRLAFVRHSGNSAADIHLLEFTRDLWPQGNPKRLTYDHRPTSSPAWTADGKSLIWTRFHIPGRQSLWKITLSNSVLQEPLPIPDDNAFGLTLSAHGDRLVYARGRNNTNIWALDLPDSHSGATATPVPRLWTASSREAVSPSFSPDGSQVAFQSSRSGWNEIWVADRDGSHLRQMTDLRGSVAGFPSWSPDRKWIVFHSRQQSVARLFLLDVSDGKTRPIPYRALNELTPSWSHDGKWIYFVSPGGGGSQVWKLAPATPGTVEQVTRHGDDWLPRESPDGKFLLYVKGPRSELWRVPVSGGQEQMLVPGPVAGAGVDYAPARQGVYFMREALGQRKETLFYFRYADQKTIPIAEMSRPVVMGLALSPDERSILYAQIDNLSSELMLVDLK